MNKHNTCVKYNNDYNNYVMFTGEIVELSKTGVKSHCIIPRPEAELPAFCIFEYVYFARPDSIIEGM